MEKKNNVSEQFKKAMQGADFVGEALQRHFSQFKGQPLTITTAEGISFEVDSFIGSFVGVNGDDERVMTMCIGNIDIRALLMAGVENDKVVKQAISEAGQKNPMAVMKAMLEQMMERADEEAENGGTTPGQAMAAMMKKGKAPLGLGVISALMAMMEDDDEGGDEQKPTGTDPFDN